MKFLTMAEILQPCVGQNWAMGAYDTCNLEITQAIVDASAADQAPAIIMIYPNHTPQAEWPTLVANHRGGSRTRAHSGCAGARPCQDT